jgi:hypothetical protein
MKANKLRMPTRRSVDLDLDDDGSTREELIQKVSAYMKGAQELRDEAKMHLAEAIKCVEAMQTQKRIAAVRRSARKKASEVDNFIDNIRRRGRRNASATIH